MQAVQLVSALLTSRNVIGDTSLGLAVTQAEELLDARMGRVSHQSFPSQTNQVRSLAWARASWDFEKLTVLPMSPAISSCV